MLQSGRKNRQNEEEEKLSTLNLYRKINSLSLKTAM